MNTFYDYIYSPWLIGQSENNRKMTINFTLPYDNRLNITISFSTIKKHESLSFAQLAYSMGILNLKYAEFFFFIGWRISNFVFTHDILM